MRAPVGLIGAPSSAGAYAPGQERAPAALRAAGVVDRLTAAGVHVEEHGDLPAFRWRPDRERPRAQNLAAVVAAAGAVAQRVAEAVRRGQVALVLGGDCTVGIGTVAGTIEAAGERVGLLYLDLHADLNTPASVPDGALDWMGVAHMLGEAGTEQPLRDLGPRSPLLAPADIAFCGFRADQATEHERAAIARLGLAVTAFDDVVADPVLAARGAVDRLLAAGGRMAVHFDVDAIDFTDAPLSENTGRNVGLPFDTTFAALDVLLADPRLAAVTVTELNPDHGEPGGATLARFAARLARSFAR